MRAHLYPHRLRFGSMKIFVARMRALIADLGAANAALHLFDRVLSVVTAGRVRIFKYYFVAQPVPETAFLARPSARMTVREISAGDRQIADFPRPRDVIEDRFRQGARCFALYGDGRFVGFIWLLFGSYQEDEVRCRYTPGAYCAWDFDVHIEPSFRLGRAFARLWDEANAIMRTKGVRWSLSRISAFNPASMTSHARMGAHRMGSALFFKVGMAQVMVGTQAPYFYVSITEKSFPTIKLAPATHTQE